MHWTTFVLTNSGIISTPKFTGEGRLFRLVRMTTRFLDSHRRWAFGVDAIMVGTLEAVVLEKIDLAQHRHMISQETVASQSKIFSGA